MLTPEAMRDHEHQRKAEALSEKIVSKAEETLQALKIEMALMKWPPEFRKIMWETIADLATGYAEDHKCNPT